MKVKLVFRERLDYVLGLDNLVLINLEYKLEYLLGLDKSVLSNLESKIDNEIIEIPCVPEKGMIFYLENFQEVYNFSDQELWLIENLDLSFTVHEISVHPKYLEVVLEFWKVFVDESED